MEPVIESVSEMSDEELLERANELRFERGKKDAEQGKPPAEASEKYLEGYETARDAIQRRKQAYSHTRGS